MRKTLSLSLWLLLLLGLPVQVEADCPPLFRDMGAGNCVGSVTEPTTNVLNLPSLIQRSDVPVRGIADIHMHQFANLGFGGEVVWGKSYDSRGVNGALAWCDYTREIPIINRNGTSTWGLLGWEAHGPTIGQGITHPVSLGIKEGLHAVGGTGPFDGWPTYKTMTHQQMYYKWLERAYQGGVRLVVMLAVSNEAMCRASKRRSDWGATVCEDMPAVERQIDAALELEQAVDWYRIARSPAEARQIIRQGKMAVVLGIEVDSLFGCKPGASCSQSYLHEQLVHYRSRGVRHIYPIHQYNNAFGGAAIFKNLLNSGNAIVTGSHFAVRDCSAEGYRYKLQSDFFVELIAALMEGVPFPAQSGYQGDCNSFGFTDTGRVLIGEMMEQSFIIDIDHMSRLMLDEMLDIAEQYDYPVVSGHTDFFNLTSEATRSEFALTPTQLQRIRDVGGMVTASTLPRNENDCFSSAHYVNYYREAVAAMRNGPYGEGRVGVAFSTDFNGWGTQVGPRFRPWWDTCGSDEADTALAYPFQGLFGGDFYPQVTGGRTFNFNLDGLAHVGLVPDLIADLKASHRLTDSELEPLYNSAETYIRMWERTYPPPTVTATVSGTKNDTGWYTSDVTVSWTITSGSENPVTSTEGCTEQTISTDTTSLGAVVTCTASTAGRSTTRSITIRRDATPPQWTMTSTVPTRKWTNENIRVQFTATDASSGMPDGTATFEVLLTNEGGNQVATHSFQDAAGNTATATAGPFNIDRTPPVIETAVAPAAPNAAGWYNSDIAITFTATDALSGVDGAPTFVAHLTADGIDLGATHSFRDVAGNESSMTKSGFKLDKTAPTIANTGRTAANGHGWNNAPVTVTWSCTDALSGVQAATLSATNSAEGASQSATQTCRDFADNSASHTVGAINIDLTSPAITSTISPAANAAGWHNTDVTLTFTAADALSGPHEPSTATIVFSDDGANLGATRTFADLAGNTASLTTGGINLDKTPPVISCVAAPPVLWPANHKLVPVAVDLKFTDALSGIPTYTLTTATSNEPNDDGDLPGDIVGFTVGGKSVAGSLRAERAGNGTGRLYTLGYGGSDIAGNTASCSTAVSVPRDQGTR